MAGRPPKDGIDYFPFEVGFFDADKVELLEGEHGAIGVYVYIRLLCLIYRDNGYYYAWTESAQMLLARRIGGSMTPHKLDLIVRSCLKWSLLDAKLFEGYHVLTSRGIQRRYLNAIRDRAKKAAAEGRHICVDDRFWLLDESETIQGFVQVGQKSENQILPSIFPGNNSILPGKKSIDPGKKAQKKRKEKESKEHNSKGEETRAHEANRLGAIAPAARPLPVDADVAEKIPKSDYNAMCAQFGKDLVDRKIVHLDCWIRNTGKTPRDIVATLKDWMTQDSATAAPLARTAGCEERHIGKRVSAQCYEQRAYTDEELNALLDTDVDALNREV